MLETGVPNLAAMLGGGIRRGTVAMVIGAPGSGKTILAQEVAFRQAREGANVLYLTGYSETHDKLIEYDGGDWVLRPRPRRPAGRDPEPGLELLVGAIETSRTRLDDRVALEPVAASVG